MTMGTASTMTAAVEALGMTLPGAASIPAVDSAHYRMAAACGRRIVEMAWEDLDPGPDPDPGGVRGRGGHRARARRVHERRHPPDRDGRARGVPLSLDDFDEIARRVPVLANIRPGGEYLMEDFYYAGGLRALLAELAPVPGRCTEPDHRDRPDARCGTGRGRGLQRRGDPHASTALAPEAGLAVLRGNLAPDGAVIKHIAADPALLSTPARPSSSRTTRTCSGRSTTRRWAHRRLGAGARNAGPLGGPGMPEYGMLPIPDYLLAAGVRDMVRISDARMSGTSYGTCVLHVAPESYVGGPLALVRTGDLITLDVAERALRLELSDAELHSAAPPGGHRRPAMSVVTARCTAST